MAIRTPRQLARRRQVEGVIRAAAPVLDLVLAVGDRVSRVVGRGEPEPEPARRVPGGLPAPRSGHPPPNA